MSNLTNTWAGYASLAAFILAYALVVFEEKLHLKKSKPVIMIGCFMWFLIGIYEAMHDGGDKAHQFLEHLTAEIGGLFFFLLVAMTYINTLEERNVFHVLRAKLLKKGLSFKQLFWATGGITFVLSPVADNLTSALLMATVALAISGGNNRFIVPSFVNIIVAANAGGAWSPFGDITTLMVWTSGKVRTFEFVYLVVPSIINWIVPALIMFPFVPDGKPVNTGENVELKPGARVIMALGGLTIFTAVSFHQFLHLPPFLGMMFGLGLLMFAAYYINASGVEVAYLQKMGIREDRRKDIRFNLFKSIEGVEFDTLLFFFGVLAAVGALQYLGYLVVASELLYGKMGPTVANIAIGVFSAVLDNIPLMYAVLKMEPTMGLDQWLLITLTTGVGGSLLSVGSAAGVAVMGVDRENYTFMSHLKWAPAIAVGYFASIGAWWLVTAALR